MRRTAEFDAFGPWVVQVHEEADVPPLFRAHPLDLDAAAVVLKVPRRISRRDANPDMDLYDHLVVAGPDALTLLTRRTAGPGFDVHTVPYDRIASVRTSVELLDGHFTVADVRAAEGGPLRFAFNGSSDDEVEVLARAVRERTVDSGAATPWRGPTIDLDLHALGPQDVALVTGQRALTVREPGVVTIVGHGRRTVRRGGGRVDALLDALAPVTLHGLVVGAAPGEVHLLHRRRWTTTSRRPVHSIAHTVLVHSRVTEVEVRQAERWADVDVVTARAGAAHLAVPVPRGTQTAEALAQVLRP